MSIAALIFRLTCIFLLCSSQLLLTNEVIHVTLKFFLIFFNQTVRILFDSVVVNRFAVDSTFDLINMTQNDFVIGSAIAELSHLNNFSSYANCKQIEITYKSNLINAALNFKKVTILTESHLGYLTLPWLLTIFV